MERRCREAGVVFQPMIFESMGGVSVEAERVLKSLNKAVAVNSDASEVKVATQFWQRIGVDILRGCCRSFHRRLVGKGRGGMGVKALKVTETKGDLVGARSVDEDTEVINDRNQI